MALFITTLSILTIIGLSATIFLGKEILKKFFIRNDGYVARIQRLVIWNYLGGKTVKPRMRKVVLKSQTGNPFIALIGFRLNIEGPLWHWLKPLAGELGKEAGNRFSGFDYYARVKSGDDGIAVFETWLGHNAVEFIFEVSTDQQTHDNESLNEAALQVAVTVDDNDPHVAVIKCQPHWWQRLGFYA